MPKADIQIEIGGRSLRLPPLSVALLEDHGADYDLIIDALKNGRHPDRELLRAVSTLLHASLAVRYPEITEREVKLGIAVGDVLTLIVGLLSQSGFPQAEEGEGKAPRP